MSDEHSSRRKFLVQSMTGVSAAWVAANWPAAAEAAALAQKSGADGRSFAYFTPAQGAEIEAMAAQIFPTTDTPGAREAHVVYFIDLGLTGFARDAQPVYVQGFKCLHWTLHLSLFPTFGANKMRCAPSVPASSKWLNGQPQLARSSSHVETSCPSDRKH